MSITHEFNYFRPDNLTEALKLLAQYREKGEILAGGTDHVVNMKDDLISPEAVIDIKRVKELKTIEVQGNRLFIGAKTTFTDILNFQAAKESFLLLWEAARTVASVGIRNRATLIGNICSAVPCMDSAPVLLCYDATVHTLSKAGERDIPIREWFLAPRKTALKPEELVRGVSFILPEEKHTGCYVKLGRYGGEDLAQAGLAILMLQKENGFAYRFAFTSVGPVPSRAAKIEELLAGKELNDELIRQAKKLVEEEISPITDIRSSREYRMHICKVMLERGLLVCRDRLQGKSVESLRILGG
jgi:carbon-monoxide dehydrogenase medium subunit